MLLKKIFEFGFIGIFLTLDTIIYDLVGKAFNIFMAIAGARLLSTEAYMEVANKVYIIVGVLMLFVLSYSILRSIIDPDKNLKEELGGKLVQRIIIAVVGLAMTPVLFNLLYQAQGLILDNNILGNLFFNDEVLEDGTDPNTYISNIGGYVTATSLWEAFFYPAEESGKTSEEIEADPSKYLVATIGWGAACVAGVAASAALWEVPIVNIFVIGATVFACASAYNSASAADSSASSTNGKKVTLREAYARTAAGDSFKIYIAFLDNYVNEGEITYLYIISTVCGAFALYAFISFSIDMGVRAAKMAYFQIVAPIPLIMQVIPSNKDIFNKYLKGVKDTFLEVFIRVSVVYIVVYIICHLQRLFSSSSALWGNQELNGPSKYFALALLILGLIAFCRKAPDIIAETLNIPKGDMKLGLRDKLAEGGAYTAGGIVGAGVTSGVRGFMKKDVAGRNAGERALRRLGYGLGGIFGGAGRAAWNQLGPGKDKTEAKDFQGMKDVAARAARAQDDAREAADARAKNREQAIKDKQKAEEKYDAARQRYRSATTEAERDAASAEMEKYRKEIEELDKMIYENTALGQFAEDKAKRIKIWATGTIDLSLEDSAIKFGGAFGDLQDKLRQEAYLKKDAVSKQLKHEYDVLEAEKVSEYHEGWDDQSYNDALRTRLDTDHDYQSRLTSYRAARSAHDTAVSDLQAAQRSGDAGRIAAATTALETANATLGTERAALDAARKVVTDSLDAEAKRSASEMAAANEELQKKRDAAKKAYEAAADAWIQARLAEGNAEVTSMVNEFLRNNADIIQNHPNMKLALSVDEHGNPTSSITVSDLVTQSFGQGGITGSVQRDAFKAPTDFVFDPKNGGPKQTFKYDAEHDVYFTEDASGHRTQTYQPGEFYTHINTLLQSVKGSDFVANTAVTRAKDTGKKVKVTMPVTQEYANKSNMRRQAEEKKK